MTVKITIPEIWIPEQIFRVRKQLMMTHDKNTQLVATHFE